MDVNRYLIVSTFVVLLGAGCSVSDGSDPVEQATGVPVSVEPVRQDTIHEYERSIARSEVVSRPTIAAEVGGRVSELVADVGDRVAGGDLLARIDDSTYSSQLAAAEADVAALQARLRQHQGDLDRMRRVGDGMYVSAAELEAAESQVEMVRQEILGAQNRRDEAQRQLDRTAIRAPFPGVIDSRSIAEGDYVSSGDAAFRLIPDSASRVSLPFPEAVGDRLELGMRVELARLGRNDDEMAVGFITRIRPRVDGSMSMVAVVEFAPPEGWQTGSMVEGRVQVATRNDALLVPAASVVDRPGRKVVFVPVESDEGLRVEEREVTIGHRSAGRTEVLSGVAADERVVVDGAAFLGDGMPVRLADPR